MERAPRILKEVLEDQLKVLQVLKQSLIVR